MRARAQVGQLGLWGLLGLGAGCADGGRTEEPGGDAVRYARAVEKGADGLADCLALGDSELRGDCVSYVARLESARGPEGFEAAHAACLQLPVGDHWRDECVFQSVDGAGQVGRRAAEACAEAGRYKVKCADHATTRTVDKVLGEVPLGEEAALEAAAEAAAAELVG